MRKQFFAAAALAMGTAPRRNERGGSRRYIKFRLLQLCGYPWIPRFLTNSSWCLTRYGIGECLFRFNENMEAEPYPVRFL